jgi:hypothetical protein
MNPLTLLCYRDALTSDPRLPKRSYDDIRARVGAAWWRLIVEHMQPLWPRVARLWNIGHPDCVTAQGLRDGYIDCDNCAMMLTDTLTHYVHTWWLRQHPEWQLEDLCEAGARACLEAMRVLEAEEQRQHQDYQIALF